MRVHRLMFVVMLYLMAASAFFIFVNNMVPWVQFRISSEPATLALLPEPTVNGPEDERRIFANRVRYGHAVLVTPESGTAFEAHTHLNPDQHMRASSDQGFPVLYRRDGPSKVQVIGGLQELESPWPWLALCIALSIVAPYARRLHAKEMTD